MITKATQTMMVHIWAIHKGHLEEQQEGAREIRLPEEEFGDLDFNEASEWDQEVVPEEALDGIFADGPGYEECVPCGFDDPDDIPTEYATEQPNVDTLMVTLVDAGGQSDIHEQAAQPAAVDLHAAAPTMEDGTVTNGSSNDERGAMERNRRQEPARNWRAPHGRLLAGCASVGSGRRALTLPGARKD